MSPASATAAADTRSGHCRTCDATVYGPPLNSLIHGDFTPFMEEDPQIWAYTRTTPSQALVVLANCGREARTIDIHPQWIGARLLLGNLADPAATIMSTSQDLAPWEALIYHADHGRQ